MGKIIRATDKNSSFKIFIADTTDIVQEIRRIHDTSATATAALGRLTSLAAIMSIDLKNSTDSITLKMKGDGPGGNLIAIAYGDKTLKASVDNPRADVASKGPDKLDVGAFVGTKGQIALIKDYGLKEPYTGISNIVSGEVAEDFANYFFTSEQTPTILSLGVFVEKDLSCSRAGGIFLQAMPFVKDEELAIAEKIARNLPALTQIMKKTREPEDILFEYFKDLDPEILSEEFVEYKCNCSREKILNALVSLPKKEIQEILDEEDKIEVTCHFCNTKYEFKSNDFEFLN